MLTSGLLRDSGVFSALVGLFPLVLTGLFRPLLVLLLFLLFTSSAVYMPVARVPAVPPRASQPFPQFERAAGFTGFTLTPLTPRPRPPTATHPAVGQSHRVHVLITHRLAHDWPRLATPLPVIGCVLPPPDCSEFCFYVFLGFFGLLSAEASLLAAAQRSLPKLSLRRRSSFSASGCSSFSSASRRSAAVR